MNIFYKLKIGRKIYQKYGKWKSFSKLSITGKLYKDFLKVNFMKIFS